MKPAEFGYERPESLEAARAILKSDGEAVPLAGGQSLVPMMNFRLARPSVVVDLSGIVELGGISEEEGRLKVGAMTTFAKLAGSDHSTKVPLIAKALPTIAHPAIRNRGTLGGSLALADPAAEMPAVALVLEARMHVTGSDGIHDVEATDWFLGAYETALEPGELLVSASFPLAGESDAFGFHEIARRHGDYAMAGAAVARVGGEMRVAVFGVRDGAQRVPAAEVVLERDGSDLGGAADALDEVEVSGDFNGDEATKRHLARVALKRALEEMGE